MAKVAGESPKRVDRDIECVGCDYNLVGLPSDAVCPECARPIAESLAEAAYTRDNPRPVPTWLRIARVACSIALAGVIVSPFVAYSLWDERNLARSQLPRHVMTAYMIVFICGLGANALGLRFRSGGRWLLAWIIAALLGSVLMSAIANR